MACLAGITQLGSGAPGGRPLIWSMLVRLCLDFPLLAQSFMSCIPPFPKLVLQAYHTLCL